MISFRLVVPRRVRHAGRQPPPLDRPAQDVEDHRGPPSAAVPQVPPGSAPEDVDPPRDVLHPRAQPTAEDATGGVFPVEPDPVSAAVTAAAPAF
eukprot:31194-Pelagococcus_subviridis.AAC.11